MIRALTVGNDPAYLCDLSVEDVGQDLRLGDDDVGGPFRTRAGERTVDRLRAADVVDGIGPGPDRAGGRCIVSPAHLLSPEQIRQGGMVEARVLGWLCGLA